MILADNDSCMYACGVCVRVCVCVCVCVFSGGYV